MPFVVEVTFPRSLQPDLCEREHYDDSSEVAGTHWEDETGLDAEEATELLDEGETLRHTDDDCEEGGGLKEVTARRLND